MIKLNIGCGNYKIVSPDHVNIDTRETPITDIVTDAWNLSMYEDRSVDEIYSRHVLEHLTLDEMKRTLIEWKRVLRGFAHIIVPDLEFHCRQLLRAKYDSKDYLHAMKSIYGWQEPERGGSSIDSHKWGYTEKSLESELKLAGFQKIERVNRRVKKDSQMYHLNVIAHI
jgi:predicted SAM-dependent methyltransferase